MTLDYGLLADLMAAAHAAVVLFIVGGQTLILAGWALRWGWPRGLLFRFVHLGAIAFVVVQTWLGELCPLTLWENELRRLAHQDGVGPSFIGYWIDRVLYYQAPHGVFVVAYTAFGALVLISFLAYPPRWRR
jgi:hypothetical protein